LQDSHCEWLIKAESRRFITLSFKLLHTECSYDYIFVYDGDSFHSPLLGSFSGKTEPQQIVASSGYVSEIVNSTLELFIDTFLFVDAHPSLLGHELCVGRIPGRIQHHRLSQQGNVYRAQMRLPGQLDFGRL
jgi:CUB domain